MNKIILISGLLLCCSCHDANDIYDIEEPSKQSLSSELQSIKNYIGLTRNVSQTRASSLDNSYSLSPYVYKGDTVLYIANYYPGWQIFSNSHFAPMVLASSEKGTLSVSDTIFKESPLALLVESLAEELYVVRQVAPLGERIPDSLKIDLSDPSLYDTTKIKDTFLPNLWYGEIDTLSIIEQDHLMSTKWGNNAPWNVYVRFVEDKGKWSHAQVGCSAIAIGQFLYYQHYKCGNPATAVSHAELNDTTHKYSYSRPSSSIWDKMSLSYLPSPNTNSDSAAVFLGEIAETIAYRFTTSATFATTLASMTYLRDKGFPVVCTPIDYSYIIEQIQEGEPVILKVATAEGGHLLVADGYRIENLRVTVLLSDIDNLPHEVTYEVVNRYIKMNWGWDGASDDIWLVASDSEDWLVKYTNLSGSYTNPITFPASIQRSMFKRNK